MESSFSRLPSRSSKISQKLVVLEEPLSPTLGDHHQLLPESIAASPVLGPSTGIDDFPSTAPALVNSHFRKRLLSVAGRQAVERRDYCRVSGYCTSNCYRRELLLHYLKVNSQSTGVVIEEYDDCIYYSIPAEEYYSSPDMHQHHSRYENDNEEENDENDNTMVKYLEKKEAFYFDYGVVVLWAFTEYEEKQMLKALSQFEVEHLGTVEVEKFKCVYDQKCTQKILNDTIFLVDSDARPVKLSISMAISQSVKLAYYEWWIDETIEEMHKVPLQIAQFGLVKMSRTDCIKAIGTLFRLRASVVLSTSILDTPDLFWTERHLLPPYETTRAYLEITQRVDILNQRTLVISDLLDMLNEHLTHNHGESLEWIVIWLILFCVILAALTIYIRIRSFMLGIYE